MSTITVLPKEIMTAVRWAFRARQIQASYAYPVGQLALKMQLFHGAGLAEVVALLQVGQKPCVPELISDEGGEGVINGRSQPPLFCASQLFDFATSRAAQQGSYALHVTNLPPLSQPLVEALLIQMGEQAFGGWVNTADSQFVGTVPIGKPPVVMGFLTQDKAIFGKENGRSDMPNHRFTLFCSRELANSPLPEDQVAKQLRKRQQAWGRAYRDGIEVETAVWSALKSITNEILI
ncbi:MAG: hypothetical protein AAF614_15235 [Chloroflexota bacterium]